MAAASAMHRGRLVEAQRVLADSAKSARDPAASPSASDGPSLPYGPLLFSNLAIAEWLVGRSDSALASALESIDLAQSLEDPFTLALGLAAAATVQMWRRDAAAALELARRGMQVSEDAGSGLGMVRAASIFQLASVHLQRTPPATALREVEKALSARAPPSRAGTTSFALVVVEIAARAGETGRALREIDDALAFAEEHDERAWEPEIHRLRGELLKTTDRRAAEHSFETAIEMARRQGSSGFELRAVMSLHGLASGATKRKAAKDLRQLYSAFTEGFTTGDLVDACRLLESIGSNN
jgi:hypothetical protein